MDNYIPNMYKKNIFDINYSKLKKIGIKCLLFDLDNTIGLIDEKEISKEAKELLTDLNKKFKVVIISNNFKKRISNFCNPIGVEYISFALKPFPNSFKKVRKKYNFKKEELCIIGDQLVTDILGGNKYGIYTILVDPLGKKDLKITSINRFIEKIKISKLTKQNLLERGKYYE